MLLRSLVQGGRCCSDYQRCCERHVAIAVPFVNERLTRRRLLFEAEQRRYDDVRTLLDATLGRMGEAMARLHDFEEPHTAEELLARWHAFTATTDEIFRDQLRLAMRLGRHDPVTTAHDDARRSFHRPQAVLRNWSMQLRSPEPEVLMSPPLQELRDDAGRAMDRFMGASRKLVGLAAPVGLAPKAP